MYNRELTHAGHVKRFSIRDARHGWEVREEQDSRVVRQVCYNDWHRVERALLVMQQQVHELEKSGWQPA